MRLAGELPHASINRTVRAGTSDPHRRPSKRGPLTGLTFAAKDMFDVAGQPTGGGNHDWARWHPVPDKHAWAVQRLLDAGATLIGKPRPRAVFVKKSRKNTADIPAQTSASKPGKPW